MIRPWLTVTIGADFADQISKSINEVTVWVDDESWRMKDYLDELFRYLKDNPSERQVTLYKITPRTLGFNRKTGSHEVHTKALELGYQVCPYDVPFAVALAQKPLPKKTLWRFPMEKPWQDKVLSHVNVFCAEDGLPRVNAQISSTARVWGRRDHLVYMK